MTTATDPTRRRGNAKGQVTRVKQALEGMHKLHPTDLDPSQIAKQLDIANKADLTFRKANSELVEAPGHGSAKDTTLEHCETELTTHQDSMLHIISMCKTLNACEQAVTLGATLLVQLEDLLLTVETGYSTSMAGQYAEVEKDFKTWRSILSVRDVLRNVHVIQMRKEANAFWQQASLARSTAMREDEEKALARLPTPITTPAPTPARATGGVKVPAPTFSGKPEDYEEFKTFFVAVMKHQTHLSEHEKNAVLLGALKLDEDKLHARTAISNTETHKEALEQFSERYEDPRDLMSRHLNKLLQGPALTNTKADIERMSLLIQTTLSGLKRIKSCSMEQFVPAYLESKLTPEIYDEWRKTTASLTAAPTADVMVKFLAEQVRRVGVAPVTAVATTTPSTRTHSDSRQPHRPRPQPPSSPKRSRDRQVLRVSDDRSCPCCKASHGLYACQDFKNKSVQERNDWVKSHSLCYNCLGGKHRVEQCRSAGRCRDCQHKHHTLLHRTQERRQSRRDSDSQPQVTRVVSTATQNVTPATAVAMISAGACQHRGRLYCDTGAEISLISLSFCRTLQARKLDLPPQRIGGVGATQSPYAVSITLYANTDLGQQGTGFTTVARAVENIPQPSSSPCLKKIRMQPFLRGKNLSDPHYDPGDRIDIILDSSTWAACRTGQSVKDETGFLIADDSAFGWVVSGSLPGQNKSPRMTEQVCVATTPKENLDDLLEKQWLMQEWPKESSLLSVEEAFAEEHFQKNHKRLPDGRREVAMPMMDNAPLLGESRSQALRRYQSVQKSMQKKGTWNDYSQCVRDFIVQNHAERVPDDERSLPVSKTYYLPMHGVIKTTSTTTKIRPVCDASAKTSTGASYNDTLATGPSLYHPLPSILLKFRDAAVAMTADVSKMYRQIALTPKDRNYHRFLYDGNGGGLDEFRMTRVTFGVKAAPFVAARTLQQIAQDEAERYPRAAKALKEAFYMDDVLTGASSIDEARTVREELNQALASAQMPLCKWRSNSSALLNTIPPELRELSDLKIGADPQEQGKALGVHWATNPDELYVATPQNTTSSTNLTKRQLISMIARIFDPMGWFAPATMAPRMLAQQAWLLKVDWDDDLPEVLQAPWQKWVETLPSISTHPIPRALSKPEAITVKRELHGFSDASEKGYGGVVYLKTYYHHHSPTISLVVARGRVAPLKRLTIPRLELSGALVVSQILKEVSQDLQISPHEVRAWTDSTIVLGWLRHVPSKLSIFVGNRIAKIQQLLPQTIWKHISGVENPADCLSRGMEPKELSKFTLWWNGPAWLLGSPDEWPQLLPDIPHSLPELRKVVLSIKEDRKEFGHNEPTFDAIVLKMLKQNELQDQDDDTEETLQQQQRRAKRDVFRESQSYSHSQERTLLSQGKNLPKDHELLSCTPFLDEHGLMRVGGRLAHADLPYTTRHPLILNPTSRIVYLFVQDRHERMKHASCSAVMADIAYSYHIPRLKQILKKVTSKCLHCQKLFGKPAQQQLGNLPSIRTTPNHVFAAVGIDYAGPVYAKHGRGRNFCRQKTYLALFVCMASRAVHIEVAEDATTQAFLAVLDRFVGRRGYPNDIFSDNGGNFIGAATELALLTKDLRTDTAKHTLSEWMLQREVKWHFTPARAPNFGGLWEAGVKQMKRLMHSTLYDLNVTTAELTNVAIAAEAILNSRPYLPLQSTSEDAICPLTPGHFLIGRPLTSMPQKLDTTSKLTNLRKWNLIRRVQHQLWIRWKKSYLPHLLKRAKQLAPHQNLQVGDIVLVSEVDTPRGRWPIGTVVATHPGQDKLVRAVEVRIGKTILKRSARHLIKLPQAQDTDQKQSKQNEKSTDVTRRAGESV